MEELQRLSKEERITYARLRQYYHCNFVMRTPQLQRVHDALDSMLTADIQAFDRVRYAPVIDALPGVGKSTAVNEYGKLVHQAVIRESGPSVDEETDRIPVVRIGLAGNTTPKSLSLQILEFFGHPKKTGSALQLTNAALDCVMKCETQLIIIDDIHFLDLHRRDGIEVSNALKAIANEYPNSFIFVGVGVADGHFFGEAMQGKDARKAQLGRRWTKLDMLPFTIETEEGREQWRRVLLTLEKALVLCDAYPGMLADDLSDYFYARTSGYIGSMMQLLIYGAAAAMKKGERLTRELLDNIRISEAAEAQYPELAAGLKRGIRTTLPKNRKIMGSTT
jgi:hypothetical protein